MVGKSVSVSQCDVPFGSAPTHQASQSMAPGTRAKRRPLVSKRGTTLAGRDTGAILCFCVSLATLSKERVMPAGVQSRGRVGGWGLHSHGSG